MHNALEGTELKNEKCVFIHGSRDRGSDCSDAGALRTYALNLRALPVVAAMELASVPFNAEDLASLVKQWQCCVAH